MSDLAIDLHWHRAGARLQSGQYSNAHMVHFNARHELNVDAAPDWGGDPDNTNPEQALAAALSSCHMMTFLALCAKAGWPVASYHDHAEAHLGKNPAGQMSVTCTRWCSLIPAFRSMMRSCSRCNTARIAIALSQIHWPTVWKSTFAKPKG